MEGLRDETKFSEGCDACVLWHLGIFELVGTCWDSKYGSFSKRGRASREKSFEWTIAEFSDKEENRRGWWEQKVPESHTLWSGEKKASSGITLSHLILEQSEIPRGCPRSGESGGPVP